MIPFNSIRLCYSLRAIARFHGGWVAPNIYYMGSCGVVQFGGLRIAGLSGIFKQQDYRKGQRPHFGLFVSFWTRTAEQAWLHGSGHFEAPPYTDSSIRSAYHLREFDVWKLAHVWFFFFSKNHLLPVKQTSCFDGLVLSRTQVSQPIDVFISHDWPSGVAHHGDRQQLFRRKPFLRQEVCFRSAARY